MLLERQLSERSLYDALPDAVITLSPMRLVVAMNRAAEVLFDISQDDTLGQPVDMLFATGQDANALFGADELTFRNVPLRSTKLHLRNGKHIRAETTMIPVTDIEDRLVAVTAVMRNVTDLFGFIEDSQIRMEKLQSDYGKLEAVIDGMPAYFAILDSNCRIKIANARFADLLGQDRNTLLGHLVCDFLSESQSWLIRQKVSALTEDDPCRVYETHTDFPDGTFRSNFWATRLFFENGLPASMVCIGYDVTSLRGNTHSISAQTAELQRKNEALGQFAAIVSHDLKAPLRHIAMFAEMMNDDIARNNFEELPVYAHHVRNSAIRMDRIIRSLLQYSQIAYKIVTRQRFDLSTCVLHCVQNLETMIDNAKAEIMVGKLPMMDGDPELMRHLLQNLISNAVKYRKPGIRPRIRVYAQDDPAHTVLIVEDNGIGIDAKDAQRIFNPFHRLHKDEKTYEGFGIGLALCKQIAESHGGLVKLDTDFTDGSRFVVTIPKHFAARENV